MRPGLRINDKIRATEVRLIDDKGEQQGLLPFEEALERAQRKELDLVEVAPDASPPVCKIMDYARYSFEQKRRMKESRKKTKTADLKEIKLRPKIDPHDFGIKLKRMKEFLEKGHKVKITMRYRPYELRHRENGIAVLDRVVAELTELAEVDSKAINRNTARLQALVLQPKKKH